MPTDGTFALETLPRNKRHLLTSLSIFFSIGSVVAAFIALLVIPANSCPSLQHDPTTDPPCDVQQNNNGWRYMFLILAVIVRPIANALEYSLIPASLDAGFLRR